MDHRNLAVLLLLSGLVLVAGSTPKHHHGKPTPTPSPTPAPTPLPAPQLTLAWDPVPTTGNPDTDAAGYLLQMGFGPGAQTSSIDTGKLTIYTVSLSRATTYYFVVRAYNAARTNSQPSNEVSYSTP